MPAFNFPIGSVVKMVNYVTIPGQVAVITHKFQATNYAGGSSFSSSSFLSGFVGDYSTVLKPLLSTGATYYGSQLYLMNPIGAAPRPDSDKTGAGVGTLGAGLIPSQACGLIAWYTDLLGKHGQGRTYIPFPAPAGNDTNGTPTTGYMAALDDYASLVGNNVVLNDGTVTATFNLVLYAGGPATALLVDDGVPRDAWATQRRRGAFGRANSVNF